MSRFAGRIVEADLPIRPRPRAGAWLRHRTADGRSVFLAPEVLDTAQWLERRFRPDESGGLLFGRYLRDGEGEYVMVTYAVLPEPGEVFGTFSTVTITVEGAEAMTERAQARRPDADLVGWYHTHPSFEAYFSPVDVDEQKTWSANLAVGLVVAGPTARGGPYAVYLGPGSDEAYAARSGMTAEAPQRSALPASEPTGPAQIARARPRRGDTHVRPQRATAGADGEALPDAAGAGSANSNRRRADVTIRCAASPSNTREPQRGPGNEEPVRERGRRSSRSAAPDHVRWGIGVIAVLAILAVAVSAHRSAERKTPDRAVPVGSAPTTTLGPTPLIGLPGTGSQERGGR